MRALTSATEQLFAPLPWQSSDRIHLRSDEDKFVARMITGRMSTLDKFVQRVPERKELKRVGSDQTWLFAATDFTAILIDEVWKKDRIVFEDPLTRLVYEDLLRRFDKHTARARVSADYKEKGIVPDCGLELPADPELQLVPYQRTACCNAIGCEGYFLNMEQGTGKTPVVIAKANNEAIGYREKHGRTYRVLIVCPKHLRLNWTNEFARFSTRPYVLEKLQGGELDRIRQIIEVLAADDVDFSVVVTSYETARRMLPRLTAFEWDLVCLDEGDAIRRPETQRFGAMLELRDHSKSRMIATGTPVHTTPLNLFGQLEFLYKGGSGFHSYKEFKKFYGKYIEDESGRQVLVGCQNMPLLQERMARFAFTITKDEAMPELPKKQYDIIEVDMMPRQAEAYRKLRDELVLQAEQTIERMEGMSESMVVNNVLTQMLRLAQITSGFLKWDEVTDDVGNVIQPSRIEPLDPNPKVDALFQELALMPQNEKAQVWVCFKEDVKAISRRAAEVGIKHVLYQGTTSEKDRAKAEYEFNHDRETRLFIGTSAGGSGLNLLGYPPGHGDDYDTNCTAAYFFSQDFKPGTRWQQEDRGHRRGTRVQFRIRDLVCPGTVDEEARARTANRKVTALTIADVRQILRNILRGKVE